jgi:hypothetical protein
VEIRAALNKLKVGVFSHWELSWKKTASTEKSDAALSVDAHLKQQPAESNIQKVFVQTHPQLRQTFVVRPV